MEPNIHYSASEESQFEKWFLEYRPFFIRQAARYVRDEEVASDIVSECFLTFWENRHSLSSETNVPAYIYTILKNRCLNYLRDQARHLDAMREVRSLQDDLTDINIASLTACDPGMLFRNEIFDILRKTLKKLPPRARKCFLRNRFDGKSYKEIAVELGISFSSVHQDIHTVLQKLRIALKDYLEIIILLICPFL